MKLLFLILGFIFCLPVALPGQDKFVIDSLKQVLETKSKGDRFEVLYRIAAEYLDHDNTKALEILGEAEAAAVFSGDTFAIVKSKRAKGQILFRMGRMADIPSIYERIYATAKEKKFMQECMSMSNTLGSVYAMQSRFDQALRYHFQAYEIAIGENDSSGMAMVLNNIGITYYKLKDYVKGLNYLKRGYDLDLAMNDIAFDTPMNISLCYVHLQDFQNARKYLDRSLDACGSKCPDYAMVHIKYARACLLLGLKQFDEAEGEFLKSYSLARGLDNSRMQLDNIYFLSELYFRGNRVSEAVKCLEDGEKIMARGIPFNLEMIKVYSRLAEYYLAMSKFEKASEYQHRYIQLKDSIYNEARTMDLIRTETEFLEREHKNRMAARDEVISLKEAIIYRQQVLNAATSLLGVLTIIFSIFLHRNYRRKKKFNSFLEEKIRARTLELEVSRDKLVNRNKEQGLRMARATELISTYMTTVQGLCLTGMKDNCIPPANSYFAKIQETALHLINNMKSILDEKVSKF